MIDDNLLNFGNGATQIDTDDLPEGSSNYWYTDERAEDAIGALLRDTTTIDKTYDDATPKLELDFIGDYDDVSGNDAGTDVTGTELETLTDGSNADALHSHDIDDLQSLEVQRLLCHP